MKVSTIGLVDESIETFPELNAELLKATKALDNARQKHAQFANDLKDVIADYKAAEARTYLESCGIDPSKPVAEQRKEGKKSPGTVKEHECWVAVKLAEDFKVVQSLEYLCDFWEKQMDAAKTQISALQSIGANMRNDPTLSGRPEARW